MKNEEVLKAIGLSDDQLEQVNGGVTINMVKCGLFVKDDDGYLYCVNRKCNKETKYAKCVNGMVFFDAPSCPSIKEFSMPSGFCAETSAIDKAIKAIDKDIQKYLRSQKIY